MTVGITVDVDKFAMVQDIEGWPVKKIGKNLDEYGYYFPIDDINNVMVTIALTESAIENMLNEIRARWPLESR